MYVSLIAILWLTHVLDVDKGKLVIILAIPTGALLLANVGLSYLRTKQMNDHIVNKENKYKIYQDKIDQLFLDDNK